MSGQQVPSSKHEASHLQGQFGFGPPQKPSHEVPPRLSQVPSRVQ